MLSVAPELVKEGGESAGFHSEVGGTQGFPPTPIFFCIALHPHLRAAEKRLKEHADWSVVRAQMDDAYLAGPVSALDEVEERLRADLVEAGLRLDRAKWLTYAEPAVRFTVTHMRNAQGLEPQPPNCRKDVRKRMYDFSRMYADVRIFGGLEG